MRKAGTPADESNGKHLHPQFERRSKTFDTEGIDKPSSDVPIEWFSQDHGWKDRNAAFITGAKALFIEATTCISSAAPRVGKAIFLGNGYQKMQPETLGTASWDEDETGFGVVLTVQFLRLYLRGLPKRQQGHWPPRICPTHRLIAMCAI